ncbi:hypothetical protein ACFX1Q_046146 [Malus domestica]
MKRKGENGALLLCFLLVLDLLDENDEFGKAEAAPKQPTDGIGVRSDSSSIEENGEPNSTYRIKCSFVKQIGEI